MFNKRTEDPFVYRAGEEIFVYNNFLWLYNVLSTCIVCTVYDCNRTLEEYQMFLSEVIDFFSGVRYAFCRKYERVMK